MLTVRRFGIFLLLAATCILGAQEAPRARGNRVCVVLGGGGALGWAHVGVLKALEEKHVPIDCITGTSAGGLVGGMLAVGMSPTEIERMLESVQWDQLFTGRPAYNDLPWRRKEDRREYPFRYEFGLRGGELRLPGGVDPAQQVGLLLSQIALPTSPMGKGAALRSFDDLVIPFRCVAADLNTGSEQVLGSGSLYTALRATMAIPVNFTPVLSNNKVLVDGGLLNNLPADVAKETFDPEFIFAVKLSGLYNPTFGQESLTDILGRSLIVVSEEQDRRHGAAADIVFQPNLADYSSVDFASAPQLIKQGYDEAMKAFADGRFAKLLAYQVNDQEWAAYQAQLTTRRAQLNHKPVPLFVRAEATRIATMGKGFKRPPNGAWIPVRQSSGPAEQELANRVIDFVGRNLEDPKVVQALQGALNRIVGEGRYESIAYEMTRNASGVQGLQLIAKEKTYAPPFVNFGTDLDTAESNVVHLTLNGRTTFVDPSGSGAEGRLSLALGSRNGAEFEYYKPLAKRSLFVAPRVFYARTSTNLFRDGTQTANYRSEGYGVGLDIGSPFRRQSEVRAGVEVGRLNNELSVGVANPEVASGSYTAWRLKYGYDDQDGDQVPSRGLRIDAQAKLFTTAPGASRDFLQGTLRVSQFTKLDRDRSMFAIAEGGSTFGIEAPPLLQFSLGGPFRLGAYTVDQLQGDNYLYGSIGLLRRVGRLPDIVGGKVFLASWYEVGGVGQSRQTFHIRNSASFGLLIETLLGPVFIGGSIGENARRTIYLTLGRGF